MPTPNPDQRRKYLILSLVAVALTVAYMVYLARIDASLPLVTRRPGGRPIVTWQRDPTGYLLAFVPMLIGMFVFVVVVNAIGEGVRGLMRGKNAPPVYQSSNRSQTPLRVTSGILSALIPGLGHAFSAHYVRSVAWLLAFIAATTASLLIFLYVPSVIGMLLPIVLVVVLRIAVVVDASRLEFNRPGIRASRRAIGVVAFGVVYLVAMGAFAMARTRMFGESFRLPSGSMQPTLISGDYVMTVPQSGETVSRNQIVVFRWSNDEPERFISRVVGLPGDTLAMRAGKLLRNGKEVAEPFAVNETLAPGTADNMFGWQKSFLADTANAERYLPTRNDWGPLVVVRNSVFVLGDNRDNSLDSRYRGLVPTSLITLTPQRVYYSRDPDTGFRWSRFGKIVRSGAP